MSSLGAFVSKVLRRLAGSDTAPAAQPAAEGNAGSPLQPAIDRIRATASWMIGALAAVATVMVAGTQLSSIGALSPADNWLRFGVAVLSVLGAVGAVGYAIYRLSVAQMPGEGTLGGAAAAAKDVTSDLRRWADADSGLRVGRTDLPTLFTDYEVLRKRQRTAEEALDNWNDKLRAAPNDKARKELIEAKPGLETALSEASKKVTALRGHMQLLVDLHQYFLVRDRFVAERVRVLVASLVAAGLFVSFAWAANPPKPDEDQVAAVPQTPTASRLILTPHGAEELGGLLGTPCVAKAESQPGLRVVALASGEDGIDVVVIPSSSCQPVRITVTERLGRVMAEDDVELTDG